MTPRFAVDHDKIIDFCRRWKVSELAFFGSVLREDFRPDSDIDVLVTFLPDAGISLFDMVDMADELSVLLGRSVDLVPKKGLKSRIRETVLESSQVIYVAA